MSASPAHAAVEKRLRANSAKIQRANETSAALEAERAGLYAEARELDPPLTFRAIAALYGVTEAAVMQKIRRGAPKVSA